MMRRFLLATLLVGVCFVDLYAQTSKKSWLIGGNLYIRREVKAGPNTWNIGLFPNAGYFVANNFAMGLTAQASFSFFKTTSNSAAGSFYNGQILLVDKINETEYSLAPFLRGYIGSKKLRPFLQAQIGYFRSRSVTSFLAISETRTDTYGGLLLGAGVGVAYFVSDSVALEAFLNSTYNEENYRFFAPSNIGLNFGIQFHLPAR